MYTSQGSLRSRLAGKRVVQAAVLGLLASGAIGLTAAAPATASGTSNVVFNCYTQWWNTAWAQKCFSPGAKWAGHYYSTVDCSAQGSRLLKKFRVQNSTTTYSGGDCTFSVGNGKMTYDYN